MHLHPCKAARLLLHCYKCCETLHREHRLAVASLPFFQACCGAQYNRGAFALHAATAEKSRVPPSSLTHLPLLLPISSSSASLLLLLLLLFLLL